MKVFSPRFLLVASLALPIGLFFAARQVASWRPVVSGEAQLQLQKLGGEIGRSGDWHLSVVKRNPANTTGLHLENVRTGQNWEPIIARGTDRFDIPYLALSSDGKTCFSCIGYLNPLAKSPDYRSCLWRRGKEKPVRLTRDALGMASFSRDDATLYIFTQGNRVEVFDARTAKHKNRITLPLLMPRARINQATPFHQFVWAGRDELWSIGERSDALVLSRLDLAGAREKIVTLSPCTSQNFRVSDTGHLLLGEAQLNGNEVVEIFDATTGAQKWRRLFPAQASARFSPDETLCAVWTGHRFEIYDAQSGRLLRWLPAPSQDEVVDFAFSSDNNRVLSWVSTRQKPSYFSQRAH